MIRLVEVQQQMNNFRLTDNLDERQTFTKIYIDRGHTGIDMTVVGDVRQIKEKLGLNKRALLKG